jgi:enediyne core biosynthesis thioesterase
MRAYEFHHRVGFEETSLVGNVYFVNHLSWQGRCREMFLSEKAPSVLGDMERGLALITTRCSCEYLEELAAFDEVILRMRLADLRQNRMSLAFEYWKRAVGGAETLVARGEQGIAFMRRNGAGMEPAAVPEALRVALDEYRER